MNKLISIDDAALEQVSGGGIVGSTVTKIEDKIIAPVVGQAVGAIKNVSGQVLGFGASALERLIKAGKVLVWG